MSRKERFLLAFAPFLPHLVQDRSSPTDHRKKVSWKRTPKVINFVISISIRCAYIYFAERCWLWPKEEANVDFFGPLQDARTLVRSSIKLEWRAVGGQGEKRLQIFRNETDSITINRKVDSFKTNWSRVGSWRRTARNDGLNFDWLQLIRKISSHKWPCRGPDFLGLIWRRLPSWSSSSSSSWWWWWWKLISNQAKNSDEGSCCCCRLPKEEEWHKLWT